MQDSERALRESEEKFRALAETTDCAIFVWREALLYVNPAASAISGYSAAELLGLESWDRIIHPDDRPVLRARAYARLRGEPVPPRIEFRVVSRDGGERWVDMSAVRIRYNGAPAILGSAFDVTERRRAEEALRESEQNLRTLAASANDGILVHVDGRIVFVNPRLSEISGYGVAELLGMEIAALVSPEEAQRIGERWQRRLRGEPVPAQYETHAVRRDGSRLPIEITAALTVWRGTPAIIVVVRDVASRKRAEAELFREKERLQVTLEAIGDGVITTDVDGRIEYLNPVAEALTGWRSHEAAGRPLTEVFRACDENQRRPVRDPVERCLAEGRGFDYPEGLVLAHRGGEREAAVEINVSPIRSPAGELIGAVLVLHDVTVVRGLARQMAWQARHDPLTGLINRSEFELRLDQALAGARAGARHALCYLDLDQFKIVNDTCGHIAGDELLRQLTARLQARVRERDTLARLGGDEFGILLEDCPLEEAQGLADAIRQLVREFRFAWHGKTFEIGASIGLVPITADSGTRVEVLSAADSACYVAKDHGRNRIHVFGPGDSALAERHGEMQWVHRVNRALGEDRFRLFFQKVLPLTAGEREQYCEILVRMVDEQGRMVTPMAFIPAAERYQIMPALDRWVLAASLEALRNPHPHVRGMDICAVNLSGQSLCDEHFLGSVLELLDGAGVEPARVCFEITETAAIANMARATRFIAALRERGCRFALDDFGSGLSSFSHLKHLPVDFLKIDGSFVRDVQRDPVDAAMVEAIHRIGKVMGIRTIAESVENDATLDWLRQLGVDYAQGSGIASPQPFHRPLTRRRADAGGVRVN